MTVGRLSALLFPGLLFWALQAPFARPAGALQTVPRESATLAAPEGTWDRLALRSVGPANMGGRVVDLAVDTKSPTHFYMATATGGLWRTDNGGTTWASLTDTLPLPSLGAVACAAERFDTVWVGGGEANPRNSVSRGAGVFSSTDGGKSWKGPHLPEAGQVGRIVIHPKNQKIVHVAVLGKLWGPSAQRGIFRTQDGGATWKQVLALDENTGCVDLAADPSDPTRLIACAWQVRRDTFSQGNPEVQWGKKSGLYLSENGGDTWRRLTDGLPGVVVSMGRAGVHFCAKDPKTVYAVLATEKTDSKQLPGQPPATGGDPATGGVFRSRDGGLTWRKVNALCPRPFYFGQVRVDPSNPERIWVLGIPLHLSEDGGKTFRSNGAPLVHVDHHALWVDPADSRHALLGNDGGLYETRDMGKNWEHKNNLPLAQFYAIAADRKSPYRIFGGLQDNGTWGGASRNLRGEALGTADWFRVMGSDGFQARVDRENDNLLYCESQYGGLRRYNLELGEGKEIRPAGTLGQPALRFNWNSPLALSPHDPKVLYYGSQYLYRSGDRGDTWVRISADMTRPGPYGTAQQNTLTAIAESPAQAGVLWTGADDGRVCVSRDAGRTWTDWSAQLPRLEGASVTCIEPSLGQAGTALVSFSRHRLEDHEPYLYRVSEFGANWQRLDGLPAEEPVHVVREDPANSSVLYAGTEAGVRISLDAGKSWAKLGKLPTVPVHDLVIQPVWRELVIATHGRGAYICDISAVGMMTGPALARDAWLYGPGRVEQGAIFGPNLLRTGQFFQGANLLPGAGFSVHFRKKPVDKARLVVRDAKALPLAELKLEQRAGFQTARWNLTALKSLTSGKGTLRVAPGQYSVVLLDGERELASASFQVHGKVPGGPVLEEEEEDNTITPGDEMSRDNPGGEKP